MVYIGGESYSCCFFKVMVRPMITAIIESIKEKFTYIAIYPLENPVIIPIYPISSYARSKASVIKTIFHCSQNKTILRILREFPLDGYKIILKILSILSVIICQVINVRPSVY